MAQNALTKHDQGTQRLVRRLRDADEEIAEIIERELSQAKRERQALIKTLDDLDRRIGAQDRATVNLKSLYDYCRNVEQELATFQLNDQRLALEALGVTVIANGREWRLNATIPSVVEAESISSNCLRNTLRERLAHHPPDRPRGHTGASSTACPGSGEKRKLERFSEHFTNNSLEAGVSRL